MPFLYRVVRFWAGFFVRIFHKIRIEGAENLPAFGGYVLCSNHISMRDPIVLAYAVDRQICYMGKKELFQIPILRWALPKLGAFPVDRDAIDTKAIRKGIELLQNGNVLGIFPEGTRVTTVSEKNMKNGVGFLALKGGADIVPVFIDTDYKLFGTVTLRFRKVISIDSLPEGLKKSEMTKELTKKVYQEIYGRGEAVLED